MDKVLNFLKPTGASPVGLFVRGAAFRRSSLYAALSNAGASQHNYTFSTPTGAEGQQPVRVVLAWTDPPGPASANDVMVNRLSLVVRQVGTQGAVFRPYVGNGACLTTSFSVFRV